MSNKFTQIYLATLNKKAEDKVNVSEYRPNVQMSDSVPGLMGRGGDADVLTNKPLSLQQSFTSGADVHPDGLNRPPTVYYPSRMVEAGVSSQMMPKDFTRYGNFPEGAEIIRPRKMAPATGPGFPQTVISPGIGGNFSYGNTPPDPTPQLRATPPGLRPDPSALGKKAEVSDIVAQTHNQSGFKGDPLAPTPTPAPSVPSERIVEAPFFQKARAQQKAIEKADTDLFFTGVRNLKPISGPPAPAPTILDLLMRDKLLAGAGLAAAGAAGYMGYKALSKKKKKKGDDDDDDKTASFTEAYHNGRKGPQSYADTYIAAFHKRAQDEPLSDTDMDDGEMRSNAEGMRRQQTADFGAGGSARNQGSFMSDGERGLVGNKIKSMARSAGNQIKSTATSAGNAISDAYGRANDFMGSKLAPVIYPKVYEEAAGVDRNIPILMEHSRFAKAIAPFDPKAPPKPGRQLSAFSGLGTPGFSKNKLNPPPQLTGLVNSAAQNMNPSISVEAAKAKAPRWSFTPSANP